MANESTVSTTAHVWPSDPNEEGSMLDFSILVSYLVIFVSTCHQIGSRIHIHTGVDPQLGIMAHFDESSHETAVLSRRR
jgi:hypothetical protein